MIKNVKESKGTDFDIKRATEESRDLSFNNHACIGCGICEITCPVDAIELKDMGSISRNKFDTKFSGHDKLEMNIYKKSDSAKLYIDEDKCVLCGMCSGLCPASALKLTIDNVPISEIPSYPKYNEYVGIDDDQCIYCQKCQIACPRDAITIERKLPNRADLVTGEISVNDDECVYCGICQELCPATAITVDQETGEESIDIDKDKCVYCLICKKVCPTNAIDAVCRICSYGEYDLDPENAITSGAAIIDEDLCIHCGWCEGVCPNDAAKVEKAFTGTLDIDENKCKSCGACVDLCPCNVLGFAVSSGPGQKLDNIVKEDDYCIRCGACEKVCPNDAITVTIDSVSHTPTNSKTWTKALDALKQ